MKRNQMERRHPQVRQLVTDEAPELAGLQNLENLCECGQFYIPQKTEVFSREDRCLTCRATATKKTRPKSTKQQSSRPLHVYRTLNSCSAARAARTSSSGSSSKAVGPEAYFNSFSLLVRSEKSKLFPLLLALVKSRLKSLKCTLELLPCSGRRSLGFLLTTLLAAVTLRWRGRDCAKAPDVSCGIFGESI